jgi:O-antigen/teichoic acid export membrane protein
MSIEAQRNLSKNTIYSLIALSITIGVRIFTAPLVVKNFDENVAGLYYFVLNITSYFLFFDFGISRSFLFIKLKIENKFDIKSYFFTAVLFYFFVVLVLLMLFLLNQKFFLKNLNQDIFDLSFCIIAISIIQLFFQFLNQLFSSIWESRGDLYFTKYFDILAVFFYIISLYLGIYYFNSLKLLFLFFLLSNILVTLSHSFLVFRKKILHGLAFNFRMNYLYNLLKSGSFIVLAGIASSFYHLLDTTLIPIFLSLNLIAFYTLSLNLTKLVHSLTGAIVAPMTVLMVSNISEYSNATSNENLRKIMLINLGSVIFITSFILLFNIEIMSLWINYNFALKVERLVYLMTIAWMFHAISITAYQFNEANNRSKVNFHSSIILSITSVTLFFILKGFGLTGFAVSRILATLVFLIYNYQMLSSGVGYNFFVLIFKNILLYFIFMAILFLILDRFPFLDNFFIKFCVFSTTFFVVYRFFIRNNYKHLANLTHKS